MDNETLMKMFLNMMDTMSDNEIESALEKAKSLMSANDYDKLVTLVQEKRKQQYSNSIQTVACEKEVQQNCREIERIQWTIERD